jgi:hypothetical protein
MSSAPDFNEVVLARKIRRVLDEGTATLSDKAQSRLASARAVALSRKKPAAQPVYEFVMVPAHAGGAWGSARSRSTQPSGKPKRARQLLLQLWLPVVVLVASLVGVAHWEEQQRVAELATLDAEVLSDALPLDAYLDHGFNEYLARNR